MRDGLATSVHGKECSIVNLVTNKSDRTHWVACYKNVPEAIYFDSYGLDPPVEIVNYLGCTVRAQTFQLYATDDVICGHLCLYVLKMLSAGEKFENIILTLLRDLN